MLPIRELAACNFEQYQDPPMSACAGREGTPCTISDCFFKSRFSFLSGISMFAIRSSIHGNAITDD